MLDKELKPQKQLPAKTQIKCLQKLLTSTQTYGGINECYVRQNIQTGQKVQFKKVFNSFHITKQKYLQRKQMLQNFSHQNYVQSKHIQEQYQKLKDNKVYIKKFTVINEFYQSVSLQNFLCEIKSKKQGISKSDAFNILFQIVNVMTQAQKFLIYHYHIHPNSILLVKDEQYHSSYFVKICDWGYANLIFDPKLGQTILSQKQYLQNLSKTSMFKYLHPQILLIPNNSQLLTQYSSKHDIWSVAIILYQLRYMNHPFQINGVFSKQSHIKIRKYYFQKATKLIQEQNHFSMIIQKMLSSTGFAKWAEIKDYLLMKFDIIELDFLNIQQIWRKNWKFMNRLIEIYKLITWSISNSHHTFWYKTKRIFKQLLSYLLKLMYILLNIKFIQRYGYRLYNLTEQQKKNFHKLRTVITQQWKFVQKHQHEILESDDFFKNLERMKEVLLNLQIEMNDYEQKLVEQKKTSVGSRTLNQNKPIEEIKKFSLKMLKAINNIQGRNKNIFYCFFEVFVQNQ